jgi:hypothetical protein
MKARRRDCAIRAGSGDQIGVWFMRAGCRPAPA